MLFKLACVASVYMLFEAKNEERESMACYIQAFKSLNVGKTDRKKKCEKPREDYLRASSSSRSLFSLIYSDREPDIG